MRGDLDARDAYRGKLVDLVGEDRLLVLPVLPRRGPRRDWTADALLAYRTEAFRLTAPSSLSGLPQVVAPVRGERRHVPVSLIGPWGTDCALLELVGDLAR